MMAHRPYPDETEAVHEPSPQRLPFPIVRPALPAPETWLPYLKTAYDRRYFSNFGPNEQLLSRRLGQRFCPEGEAVLTCNATAALTATLIALEIRGIVAVPAFTFPAVLQAIAAAGCQPLLLDVDPLTWELRAETVAQAMTRIRIDAIMPVRVFGLVRDHGDMIAWASERQVPIIFDAAGALGHAQFPVGERHPGYVEVFSLHATKAFAVGEGGAIFCAPSLAAKIRRVINFGLAEDRSFTDGLNGKMSELHAAIGLAALDGLEAPLMRRQAMAAFYQESLSGQPGLTLPVQTAQCPWPLFPVLTRPGTDVAALQARARRSGLQLARYYHPSLTQGYRGTRLSPLRMERALPVADLLSQQMICLPVYADGDDEELAQLAAILADPEVRLYEP